MISLLQWLAWTPQTASAQDVVCTGSGWETQENAGACEGTYCAGLNALSGYEPPRCFGNFISECQIFCDSLMGVGLQTGCQCVISTQAAIAGAAIVLALFVGCFYCCCKKSSAPRMNIQHHHHQRAAPVAIAVPSPVAMQTYIQPRAAPVAVAVPSPVAVQTYIQPVPNSGAVHGKAEAALSKREKELLASYGGVVEGAVLNQSREGVLAPAASPVSTTTTLNTGTDI